MICERLQETRLAQIPQGGLSVRGAWRKPHPSEQFTSPPPRSCCLVAQSCPTLCDNMDCSTPGFPVLHHLLEFAQTHVHRVSDAIQPSHPLSSPSPLAFNLSQHQGLYQWVLSLHQVAKVLEFQPQYQSLQWIFRIGFQDGLVGSPCRDSQESSPALWEDHASPAPWTSLSCTTYCIEFVHLCNSLTGWQAPPKWRNHVLYSLIQQIQKFQETLRTGNLEDFTSTYLFLAVLGLRCCSGFSPSCGKQGLLSSWAAQTCHCSGFSLQNTGLRHAGFRSCSSGVLESRLNSCGPPGLAAPWHVDWVHLSCTAGRPPPLSHQGSLTFIYF